MMLSDVERSKKSKIKYIHFLLSNFGRKCTLDPNLFTNVCGMAMQIGGNCNHTTYHNSENTNQRVLVETSETCELAFIW